MYSVLSVGCLWTAAHTGLSGQCSSWMWCSADAGLVASWRPKRPNYTCEVGCSWTWSLQPHQRVVLLNCQPSSLWLLVCLSSHSPGFTRLYLPKLILKPLYTSNTFQNDCEIPQSHIYALWWDFSWAAFELNSSTCMRGSPVPYSSLWHFRGLFSACSHVSFTEEPRTGRSIPGAASAVLNRREGSHPLTC